MSPISPTRAPTAPTSGRGTSTPTTASAIPTRATGAHERQEAANQSGAAPLNRESHRAKSPQHEAGPVVTPKGGIESTVGGKTSARRLWDRIVSLENCREAVREECRTRRFRRRGLAGRLLERIDEVAAAVSERLRAGFAPETPTEFDVVEAGKTRHITVPSKRDSLAIRAAVRVVEPFVYARMTPHSYCPVKGRGGLRLAYDLKRALRRANRICARHNARRPNATRWRVWALKSDIRKFFPSLGFAVLMDALTRIVGDQRIVALFASLLGFRDGLYIGAGYSAMLANAALIDTDWAMMHADGCLAYFRYMDDTVMLFRSKARARAAAEQLAIRLAALGLSIEGKWRVFRTDRNPICVGGYKVRARSIHAGRRPARHLVRLMRRPYRELSGAARAAADSLYGYVKRTDSYHFQTKWRDFK